MTIKTFTAEEIIQSFEENEKNSSIQTESHQREFTNQDIKESNYSSGSETKGERDFILKMNHQEVKNENSESAHDNSEETMFMDESLLTQKRYRMNEIVGLLNSSDSTIRYWVNQLEDKSIHYVERNHRNERVFNANDVRILYAIRYLLQVTKKVGTIEDAVDILSEHFPLNNAVPESLKEKPQLKRIIEKEKAEQAAELGEIISASEVNNISMEALEELFNKHLDVKLNAFANAIVQKMHSMLEEQQTLLLESKGKKQEQQVIIEDLLKEIQSLKEGQGKQEKALIERVEVLLQQQHSAPQKPQGFFEKLKYAFTK